MLVGLSLASLASGTRAGFIQRGIRTFVTVTSHPFLKAMRGVKDASDYVTGLILDYDAAREEAQTMRTRFAELMQSTSQHHELRAENQRLRRMLHFVRNQPRLTLEPVDVIENFKGILKIDRGAIHGVEESMSVVTEDGIVGLVTEVDLTTATVVTLHNVDCKIGAMIRRNRVRGVVHGSGSDLSDICTMEYIDMKDEVCSGDEVVASPESQFPVGYPIGSVLAVRSTGALWQFAEVRPAVDPYRVDEVFLVRQATLSSKELAGPATPVEAPGVRGHAVPDGLSIQGRLAP